MKILILFIPNELALEACTQIKALQATESQMSSNEIWYK